MTRGIILAAGRGSRMGKETEDKPKCLTILNGKPLLEWQLSALQNAGIERIEIVSGYKGNLIQKYKLLTYSNPNWSKTNMVTSLFCVPPFKGDSIISYSDIAYSHKHVEALN